MPASFIASHFVAPLSAIAFKFLFYQPPLPQSHSLPGFTTTLSTLQGRLYSYCIFYFNKLYLHFLIIFSLPSIVMSPLLGRTRLCFLPIDVRCLHITQTVRLWTRQKEKVRLEGKMTQWPSQVWTDPCCCLQMLPLMKTYSYDRCIFPAQSDTRLNSTVSICF